MCYIMHIWIGCLIETHRTGSASKRRKPSGNSQFDEKYRPPVKLPKKYIGQGWYKSVYFIIIYVYIYRAFCLLFEIGVFRKPWSLKNLGVLRIHLEFLMLSSPGYVTLKRLID